MKDKVYVVYRSGVYQQGVFGVHASLQKAKEHAEVLAANEEDDYHQFCILKFNLGEMSVPLNNFDYGGEFIGYLEGGLSKYNTKKIGERRGKSWPWKWVLGIKPPHL